MRPWSEYAAELQRRGIEDEETWEKVRRGYLAKLAQTPEWQALPDEEKEARTTDFVSRGRGGKKPEGVIAAGTRALQRGLRENLAALPEFAGEVVHSIGRDVSMEETREEVEKRLPWLKNIPIKMTFMGPQPRFPEEWDIQKRARDWLFGLAEEQRKKKKPASDALPAEILEGVASAPAHLASLLPYGRLAAEALGPGPAGKAKGVKFLAQRLLPGALTFGGRAMTRAAGHGLSYPEAIPGIAEEAALGAAFSGLGMGIKALGPEGKDVLKTALQQRLAHAGGAGVLGGGWAAAQGGAPRDIAREAAIFAGLGAMHGGEPTMKDSFKKMLDVVDAETLLRRVTEPKQRAALKEAINERASERPRSAREQRVFEKYGVDLDLESLDPWQRIEAIRQAQGALKPKTQEYPEGYGPETGDPLAGAYRPVSRTKKAGPRGVFYQGGVYSAANQWKTIQTLYQLAHSKFLSAPMEGKRAWFRQLLTNVSPEGKPFSAFNAHQRLADIWGLVLRGGRLYSDAAKAEYHTRQEVARTTDFQDFNINLHEIGHHIRGRELADLVNNHIMRDPEARAEMDSFTRGGAARPEKYSPEEGFAEYLVEKMMSGDFSSAAPRTKKILRDFLKGNRPVADALDATHEIYKTWESQDDLQKAAGMITRPVERSLPPIGQWGIKGTVSWVDSAEPVRRLVKAALLENPNLYKPKELGGEGLTSPMDVLRRVDKSASSEATFMLEEGIMVPSAADPTVMEVLSPGLHELFARNGLSLKNFNEYDAYAKAKSVVEDANEGRKTFTEEELNRSQKAVAAFEEKYGEDRARAQIYNTFGNGFVKWLQRKGVLTKEAAKDIITSRDFWASLERHIENPYGEEIIFPREGGLNRLKIPTSHAIVRLLHRGIAATNRSWLLTEMLNTANAIQGGGKAVFQLKKPIDESYHDQTSTVTFTNLNTSERVSTELDPILYESIRGIDPIRLPKWADWLFGKPKRAATLGMTGLNIGFALGTNAFRDTWLRYIQTEYKGKTPLKTIGEAADAWWNMMKYEYGKRDPNDPSRRSEMSEEWQNRIERWKMQGGEMSMVLGLERHRNVQAIADAILANDRYSRGLNVIKHPVESIRAFFSATEAMNRLAEYKATEEALGRETGLSPLDPRVQLKASVAAGDITTDFKRMGTYAGLLNEMIPFFNATIQGAYKAGRAFRASPTQTALAAMSTITFPAMGIWALNKDEQWYQELPDWEKSVFMHIPVGTFVGKKPGDVLLRVPYPFEWGTVFGSLPVSFLESMRRDDNMKHFADMVARGVENNLPDYMPVLPKIGFELASNQNLFQNRPIESKAMERQLKADRYTAHTADAYKKLSALTRLAPFEFMRLSPVKTEHLIRSATGGLFHEPFRSLDLVTEPSIHNVPIASRFFSRTDRQGQSVSDFYDLRERMDQAYNSARQARERGDTQRAERILKKYKDDLGLNDAMIDYMMTYGVTVPPRLSRLRKIGLMMADVRRSPNYDPRTLTALARAALGREVEWVVQQ